MVQGMRWLFGMHENQILSLRLDEVAPDPEQPRKHFDRTAMDRLKAAIFAVGQLQPIRVRSEGDRWMIVDGQRRWLAISSLARQHPGDPRFETIRAYVGGEMDDGTSSRRVVQVLSNIGEDLTPIEKAEALEEISRAEPHLGLEELAQRLGVPKGQVNFLRELGGAPAFIRALGAGSEQGSPLSLWNLVTLVRLHRKLRRWDDDRFRETEGGHQRIAGQHVGRLGRRAQQEGWGKRRLQTEADRILRRVTGVEEDRPQRDRLAGLRRLIDKVGSLSRAEREEMVELLTSALELLTAKGNRRARA